MFFPRKRYGWGAPDTWQGRVFLTLWGISFATAIGSTPTALNFLASLVLIGFLLFVASIEER